ncbi:CLUMA_CG021050, isoform A [Clunio marinus]|uniref:CLUMA_CG021050, isoform A n=1 Tax=Clunio marinus TaxID=568069 RepID=A0A1J1J9H4_9DIPT|nr:CLUMA_CG021050, isoform A [Clunio marinus]
MGVFICFDFRLLFFKKCYFKISFAKKKITKTTLMRYNKREKYIIAHSNEELKHVSNTTTAIIHPTKSYGYLLHVKAN